MATQASTAIREPVPLVFTPDPNIGRHVLSVSTIPRSVSAGLVAELGEMKRNWFHKTERALGTQKVKEYIVGKMKKSPDMIFVRGSNGVIYGLKV